MVRYFRASGHLSLFVLAGHVTNFPHNLGGLSPISLSKSFTPLPSATSCPCILRLSLHWSPWPNSFIRFLHLIASSKIFLNLLHQRSSFKPSIQALHQNFAMSPIIHILDFKCFIKCLDPSFSSKYLIKLRHPYYSYKFFFQKHFIEFHPPHVSSKCCIKFLRPTVFLQSSPNIIIHTLHASHAC